MNWTVVGKTLREIDWGLRETGRSLGQFTILCLALILLVLPGMILLAVSALIGVAIEAMFGGGFTTIGIVFFVVTVLIGHYCGAVVQNRVKLAVLALVAEPPRPGAPRR